MHQIETKRAFLLGPLFAALLGLTAGCGAEADGERPPRSDSEMNTVAEAYVRLVLAVGQHDDDYVDAYHGPEEWAEEIEADPPDLATIAARADSLLQRLAGVEPGDDGMENLRHAYLTTQLESLAARVEMLRGRRYRFDEESRALYDAVAPAHEASEFDAVLAELEDRLPGDGPLHERYESWKADFVIPEARLDTVFRAAVDECRTRTLRHLDLPDGESFVVEYVTDRSWSGYNWYQGDYHSLIQVNTDLPIHIDRAIDLACHEGYPGHHTYNVLLERDLRRGRGWIEFSVYPLFSPQSLIAEGTANYGIRVAFPDDERVAFERDVLFPLAGLDPARADEYYGIERLVDRLSYAGNEAARRYLNGGIDADAAADWLARYALMPRSRAGQRVRFIDQYRSYVINYNYGEDLVAAWVERHAGPGASRARVWEVFGGLLASPRLPSSLLESSGS